MGTNFYGRKIPQTKSLNEIAVKILNSEISGAKELLDNLLKETEIHIGKLSGGWKFLFDSNEKTFNSINEYKEYLKDYEIMSEYGESYSFEEFWEKVNDNQNERIAKLDYSKHYFVIDNYEFSKSTNFC